MIKMRIIPLAAILILLGSCESLSPSTKIESPVKDLRTDAHTAMTNLIDDGFKGSVLVACGDDIVLHENYGIDHGDADIIRYWVASITKPLTAIAIMTLVEKDLVSLDDKLTRFFPEVPADKTDITVFHLLTHSSGLPQNYAAEGNSEIYSASAAIFDQPLSFEPGETFGYSNDGYSLLGMIIEIVSDTSYDDYISATIMNPLNLEDVAFIPEPQRDGEYIPPLLNPYPPSGDDIDWGFRGGHGARLSVGEIYTITTNLLAGKLVTKASLNLLHGQHIKSLSGLGVGMGWFTETDADGRQLVWMRGSDQSGGNALAYIVKDANVIIVAASNAGPDKKELRGWSLAARDALLPIYAPINENGVQSSCR